MEPSLAPLLWGLPAPSRNREQPGKVGVIPGATIRVMRSWTKHGACRSVSVCVSVCVCACVHACVRACLGAELTDCAEARRGAGGLRTWAFGDCGHLMAIGGKLSSRGPRMTAQSRELEPVFRRQWLRPPSGRQCAAPAIPFLEFVRASCSHAGNAQRLRRHAGAWVRTYLEASGNAIAGDAADADDGDADDDVDDVDGDDAGVGPCLAPGISQRWSQ